ncbi:MAG: Hsp20/alpha crystallin family protein [Campylobacterales bacterium]|nr:Hsp20/alpha crystallin family protein [Campylobacterales bacterium]
MLITKFNPVKDLESRLMQALRYKDDENDGFSYFTPSVNTKEGKYAYHIEVDLPGVKKEDIHVDLNEDMITISGERNFKQSTQEDEYYKMESFYGKFQRSFNIPENADRENIEANSENGVLEIVIPKLKEAIKETKKIEVK